MRIGGGIERPYQNPQEWYQLVEELGYRAVLAPIDYKASKAEKESYLECIKDHDLVLGEVGAWSNPVSINDEERKTAILYCQNQLALAEELGANCCVNIAGSRGDAWDGFCPENYTKDTYALIVDTVREIIDAVNPVYTSYTLEPMPWMVPSSVEENLQLIRDVDRKSFGVHFDLTNMINCPERYVNREAFIENCFAKLSPYIKSVHVKDVIMENHLPCVIREVMPGKGGIDFQKVVKLCESLGSNTTVYVEHLPDFESYKEAAAYVRQQAIEAGVRLL